MQVTLLRTLVVFSLSKPNAFSFRELRPPDPHRGLCLWTFAGGFAPNPHYRLSLRAGHCIQTLPWHRALPK